MLYFEPLNFICMHVLTSLLLCLVILILVYVLHPSKPSGEKNMAYECGFKPFDFTYYPFDVQFYRVGILFLLFDVEIMFFFPWVLNFYQISIIGHVTTFLFIGLLFLGFVYEITVGVISWYPQLWKSIKSQGFPSDSFNN